MGMGQENEYRLWDSQWVNIVNHERCYEDLTTEDAVALAVQLTERAMAKNFMDGKFPPKRVPPKDVQP